MSSSVNGLGGSETMNLKHFSCPLDFLRTISKRLRKTYIKTLCVLLLLFVYDPEAEVHLIGLLEVRGHAHDLRESLFGMIKRAVTIV